MGGGEYLDGAYETMACSAGRMNSPSQLILNGPSITELDVVDVRGPALICNYLLNVLQ